MSTDEILKERGADYGDYLGGSQFRRDMMNLIKRRHLEVNGEALDQLLEIYIFDIVNKLSRISATPDHLDSWQDIEGYSHLIVKEIKNADK